MARSRRVPTRRIPKLQYHKVSGQGVVRLNQKDRYCGPWGTAECQAKYHRLIGEWLAPWTVYPSPPRPARCSPSSGRLEEAG